MVACREAIRIAAEHDDPSAAAHAEMALEEARGAESLAVELESALLHQISGVADVGMAETCFDDPDMVRSWGSSLTRRCRSGRYALGPSTVGTR